MTKENFLESICPEMKIKKSFFICIYGYELTYPGFAETALTALEDAGCRKAREYYKKIIDDYKTEEYQTMKNVSQWYAEQLEKKKGGENNGIRKERRKAEFTGFPEDW